MFPHPQVTDFPCQVFTVFYEHGDVLVPRIQTAETLVALEGGMRTGVVPGLRLTTELKQGGSSLKITTDHYHPSILFSPSKPTVLGIMYAEGTGGHNVTSTSRPIKMGTEWVIPAVDQALPGGVHNGKGGYSGAQIYVPLSSVVVVSQAKVEASGPPVTFVQPATMTRSTSAYHTYNVPQGVTFAKNPDWNTYRPTSLQQQQTVVQSQGGYQQPVQSTVQQQPRVTFQQPSTGFQQSRPAYQTQPQPIHQYQPTYQQTQPVYRQAQPTYQPSYQQAQPVYRPVQPTYQQPIYRSAPTYPH
jgi:hypothetical protein